MKKKPVASEFLFARPGVSGGVARFLDFAGSFDRYNESPTEDEADEIAAQIDWQAVGQDIWSAIQVAENEDNSADEAA